MNIETHHPFRFQRVTETPLQLGAMDPFHYEDHIRPYDEFRRERGIGVVIGTGGTDFEIPPAGRHLFRGRATDEQNVFQCSKPQGIKPRTAAAPST
jgi:hypothetical protein